MNRLSWTIIVLALALANRAGADTLMFGPLDAEQIPLTTYTEGNFTVQAVNGTSWDIVMEGNPPDALSTDSNGVASPGDEVDIYRNDGGLFTFTQFDSSAGWAFLTPPVTSDEVNFLGSVNSVGTQRLLSFTNDSGPTFTTTSTGFSAPINLLRIVIVSAGSDYLLLDNLVVTPFNPVPEPSSAFVVPLVLLSGWAWFRRKRYWHSAGSAAK